MLVYKDETINSSVNDGGVKFGEAGVAENLFNYEEESNGKYCLYKSCFKSSIAQSALIS